MILNDYDLVIINSSGGKDSQAMLTHIVGLAVAQNYDRAKLVVAHADLGRVEWKDTRELAERQADHYGLRFEAMARPQGDLLDHVEDRGMWPSSKARFCTSDHKRGQVAKIMTMLVQELSDGSTPIRVLNAMGIRADESTARAKKKPFARNARATGKGNVKIVDDWLPIFDWSVDQVWKRIRESGVEHHGAYDLGMPRLSCVFCIFAPKSALLIAGEHNPELLDEYIRVEDKIGHTFKSGFRIAEIKSALASGERGQVTSEESCSWNM